MKLYIVAVEVGFPRLIEIDAVERANSYKIDGEESAWTYRKLIRKDELPNLRIGTTSKEALALYLAHTQSKVNSRHHAYIKALEQHHKALEFERRFNAKGQN